MALVRAATSSIFVLLTVAFSLTHPACQRPEPFALALSDSIQKLERIANG